MAYPRAELSDRFKASNSTEGFRSKASRTFQGSREDHSGLALSKPWVLAHGVEGLSLLGGGGKGIGGKEKLLSVH
jgi:hypothetical protein